MFRKLLVSSVAVIASLATAVAADLPSRTAPPAYAPALPVFFTWTGFYVGVNGGFGGDRFRYPLTAGLFTGSASITSSGPIGGGQIGANFQVNQIVVGAEADFQGAHIRGGANINVGPVFANASSTLDYLGTVRARLGWTPMDRFMVYATGGFAYGSTNTVANAGAVIGAGVSRRLNQYGYTIGGGLEYALVPNWTIKTEYLYVDLRNGTNNNLLAVGGPLGGLTVGLRGTDHIVRAGVNYKFGWGGPTAPVVARY